MASKASALAGRRAGKLLRDVAVELYGREQAEACWRACSPLRSKLRRLLFRTEEGSGVRPAGAVPDTA